MVDRFKKLVQSRYFFGLVIALFAAQGIWFAVSIAPGLPADETYHREFIDYYARQPLLHGPLITSQPESTYYLGDLVREPSYLYHYLMSLPQRIFNYFNLSLELNTIALRLITLLFSVASLFVLRSILQIVGASKALSQLTVAGFSLVGMLIWISAAINYDALSLLLFLLLVYSSLAFTRAPRLLGLITVIILFFLGAITKYTILPVAVLVLVLMLISIYRQGNINLIFWKKIWSEGRKTNKSPVLLLLFAALIISAGLFIERPVKNYVVYGQASPACDKVHSQQQCLRSALFARNFKQKTEHLAFKASGGASDYQPIAFTKDWLKDMYGRLYFYFGHKSFTYNHTQFYIAAILGLFSLFALVATKFKRLFESPGEKILAILSVFYVLQLLAFNTLYFLNMGAKFGFQGRYLLPITAFVIYFILKAGYQLVRNGERKSSQVTICLVAVIITLFTLTHLPFLQFISQTNSDWYSETAKSINVQLNEAAQNLPRVFTDDR